jgi:hypothetical protein
MARDAGGTYTAPSNSFNPAVEGTAIDEGDWNTTLDDIETAFTESVFTGGMGATDNQLVRTDGTGTKKVQGTTITCDDSMKVSGIAALAATTIELGHASDTTLARSAAGTVTIEGNVIYRAGGTDVPVTDGGTGASTAAGAATNLGLGTGDSPQFTAINLGHASDTTLTRGVAGALLVEGKTTGYLLDHSAAGSASTNTTSEEVLATVAIPAAALGANGFLLIEMSWSATNNANAKTVRARFGASGAGLAGTAFPAVSVASGVAIRLQSIIQNRNATNSQIGGTSPGSQTGFSLGTAAIPTGVIDTTAATEIAITSEKATGTDTLTLEAYSVWLFYKA